MLCMNTSQHQHQHWYINPPAPTSPLYQPRTPHLPFQGHPPPPRLSTPLCTSPLFTHPASRIQLARDPQTICKSALPVYTLLRGLCRLCSIPKYLPPHSSHPHWRSSLVSHYSHEPATSPKPRQGSWLHMSELALGARRTQGSGPKSWYALAAARRPEPAPAPALAPAPDVTAIPSANLQHQCRSKLAFLLACYAMLVLVLVPVLAHALAPAPLATALYSTSLGPAPTALWVENGACRVGYATLQVAYLYLVTVPRHKC
ncbi:hypothetical protein K491DRAFT_413823 [Lophiostoma macrostomum CBS 122681]|uniref:Uncharacterized protein n=1 Tax=Lophiostoma macrostomum CBS 122681 TaxID=1314788 RepID=A0A6A6T6J4_9PLEO|nr:hypothetical protein K491DRAFT_413823 [Lophiostoma macrostomum CBS 122681]